MPTDVSPDLLPDNELDRLLQALLRLISAPAPTDGVVLPRHADEDDAHAASANISGSEARALIELAAARGIAQGELASLLGLEKSTVSRLAVGLQNKGWLQRGRDSDDQRYVRLYLTPQGSAVARRVWQAWQSRQERMLAGLSAEERAGLASGLRGLVRGLAADTDRPSGPATPIAANDSITATTANGE